MIRLTLPGKVVPQLRPRFARHGTHVQTYDPDKCRNYKAYVRILAANQMTGSLFEGAVEIRIIAKALKFLSRGERERVALMLWENMRRVEFCELFDLDTKTVWRMKTRTLLQLAKFIVAEWI
jgi:Holliday junction resolvase RusA-like endonuclease